MNLREKAAAVVLVMAFALAGCNNSADTSNNDNTNISNNDTNVSQISNNVSVDLDEKFENIVNTNVVSGNTNNFDGTEITLNDNSASINGKGAELKNGVLKISEAGTYILTGNFNGQVKVNAGDTSDVILILNGVKINCSDSSAIFAKKTKSLKIVLAEGSVNYLSDGSTYTFEEGETEPDAALFSKCDLTIEGDGKLVVAASYNDGIKSKDILYINSGNITVAAVDDGICGRDLLSISGGSFDITSGGDGFKSTNDKDETLGNIVISSGSFNINAKGDGISSENELSISGGEFMVITNGGSANAPEHNDFKDFDWRNPVSSSSSSDSEDSTSNKGIKAANKISISGGTFNIDSLDDSIHSNGDVLIENGSFSIAAGDDGIHADLSVTIDGGIISILNSYEGIEGEDIIFNGGDISIVASDDGINAASSTSVSGDISGIFGGNQQDIDNSKMGDVPDGTNGNMQMPDGTNGNMGERPDGMNGNMQIPDGTNGNMGERPDGMNGDMQMPDGTNGNTGFPSEMKGSKGERPNKGMGERPADGFNGNFQTSSSNALITINGGNIYVDAKGDGIDSNGSIIMTGGCVTVIGPSDNGNGSLDYDNTFELTGGELICAGSSGMAQYPSSITNQGAIVFTASKSLSAKDTLEIKDANENTIMSLTVIRNAQSFIFTKESLKSGEMYYIYKNGEKLTELTLKDGITYANETGVTQNINNMGGFKGRPDK